MKWIQTGLVILASLWFACQQKVSCPRLEHKAKTCRLELYEALAGPEARLLDRLSAPDGPLKGEGRQVVATQWDTLRRARARELAEALGTTCRKHQGAVWKASEIMSCLKIRDCREFAKCLAKVLRTDRGDHKKFGTTASSPESRLQGRSGGGPGGQSSPHKDGI